MPLHKLKMPTYNYTSLYDSLDKNTYQLKLKVQTAKYWPTGKYAVIKTGIKAGWLQSPTIFRNEMFQIGGFQKLYVDLMRKVFLPINLQLVQLSIDTCLD
jgi:hypothetical protein